MILKQEQKTQVFFCLRPTANQGSADSDRKIPAALAPFSPTGENHETHNQSLYSLRSGGIGGTDDE